MLNSGHAVQLWRRSPTGKRILVGEPSMLFRAFAQPVSFPGITGTLGRPTQVLALGGGTEAHSDGGGTLAGVDGSTTLTGTDGGSTLTRTLKG